MEWSQSIQGMFTWIHRPSPGGSLRFQGEKKCKYWSLVVQGTSAAIPLSCWHEPDISQSP